MKDTTNTNAAKADFTHSKITYLPDVHRLLPQAPDAEQGVLSSFLLAPKEVGGMCAERLVTPAHFHIPAHAEIFGLLMERWGESAPIDFINIAQDLKDRNKLDAVGGAAFVSSLFMFLPTAANASYYLEIIKEKYVLREIIRICTEYAARSYDEQADVPAVLDGCEQDIMAIRSSVEQAGADHAPKDLAMQVISDLQKLYDNRGRVTGLPTGFPELDKLTNGLQGSNMYVVAARPSMGKTALGMNVAEHVAINTGQPVAVFSMEMSARELAQRVLCSMARVNPANIREGLLSDRDFPALTASAAKLAGSKLLIYDRSGLTIQQLRAKARAWKRSRNISAVIVDYIGLLRTTTKRSMENRQLEIAEYSAGLKALAKELDIPVIVLAQLNRNPDSRGAGSSEQRGRPRLSDLRESGAIEQDADFVGLLYREDYYAETEEEKEESDGRALLIVAKHRNGPTGDIKLTFLKQFARFVPRASEGHE